MGNPPFEDVSPIKQGGFFHCYISLPACNLADLNQRFLEKNTSGKLIRLDCLAPTCSFSKIKENLEILNFSSGSKIVEQIGVKLSGILKNASSFLRSVKLVLPG